MIFRRRVEVVTLTEPSRTTADLLLDEARRAEETQQKLHAAMDQRAGVLLGFSGVFFALMLNADLAVDVPTWARLSALGLIFAAAASAAHPLVRRPLSTVSTAELSEHYETAPIDAVIEVVTSQLAWNVADSGVLLGQKMWAVRLAAVLLVTSVLVAVVGTTLFETGLLTSIGGGR